jgi:hypothetical protein
MKCGWYCVHSKRTSKEELRPPRWRTNEFGHVFLFLYRIRLCSPVLSFLRTAFTIHFCAIVCLVC